MRRSVDVNNTVTLRHMVELKAPWFLYKNTEATVKSIDGFL